MSYADDLTAAKEQLPFRSSWRENFKHGLEQYTEENCAKAEAILVRLIDGLISIGESAGEKEKVQLFETATLSLNDLNKETDWALIETGEREELCELMNEIAQAAGIDHSKYGHGEGLASEWRDW